MSDEKQSTIYSREMTIQQIAQAANDCQNACNLGALLGAWASWRQAIRADADARGIEANKHPIHCIMAEKLAQLASGDNFVCVMPSQAYIDLQALANVTTEKKYTILTIY